VRGGGSKLVLSWFGIASYIVAEGVLEMVTSFGASFNVPESTLGDMRWAGRDLAGKRAR
jgi:hypothetical protein